MQFHDFVFGHIEVEVQGRAYDLHNFYEASAIKYDIVDRSLVLSFVRWPDAWVPDEEAEQIIITFKGVSYFSAAGMEPDAIDEDGRCVHAIGVVHPDAATEEFYLTDIFPADHHLVIQFESGLALRIQADAAECAMLF
ncbi:hypothetical protein [Pseudomonas sp. Fl4BN1]|uniref:hypothetical protein n=1 Tax=Pseudomonas sp. Fl4BN1 TaxID=2697651 RepID=UPI0013781B83|nr:hypothetical protein [Pseudomonas sp. Fl4BN1]NBF13216.1 hypothetical protein [Pseudomonas sp. Fl4BN1]